MQRNLRYLSTQRIKESNSFLQRISSFRSQCTLQSKQQYPSSQLLYLSFYKYTGLKDLPLTREKIYQHYNKLGVLGRIYIADEGINAQISIPEKNFSLFKKELKSQFEEQGFPFADVFLNRADLNDGDVCNPFDKLKVKIRPRIVNDGFDEQINMENRGKEIGSREWDEVLNSHPKPILLDCRNYYEHEVGRFEGSQRIMVDTFKDTFQYIDKIVEREKPDAKFAIYCTGGIRCEKVGAYLVSKGFHNVNRLKGGIEKYMQDTLPDKSLFKGKNFVFDSRISKKVTEDVLSSCYQCGSPCDVHVNCSNKMCGGLFIQCLSCATKYQGACSTSCADVERKFQGMTELEAREFRKKHGKEWKHPIPNALYKYNGFKVRPLPMNCNLQMNRQFHTFQDQTENYALQKSTLCSSPELEELREETVKRMKEFNMMISEVQVAFLQFLIQSYNCKRVLELGCFTGYSALGMAEVLDDNGKIISCDVDTESTKLARRFIAQRKFEHKIDIKIAPALDVLSELHSNGDSFDLIFVDADKGGYKSYYDYIISNGLLQPNGIMVFDNVLFNGEVVNPSTTNNLARHIQKFNDHIMKDPRTSKVLLPFGDGMTLVQHKK